MTNFDNLLATPAFAPFAEAPSPPSAYCPSTRPPA